MVFENVINVIFINTYNLDLNPTKLSNEVFTFCSILSIIIYSLCFST